MSQVNPYQVSQYGGSVMFADQSERTAFIRRTYTHLSGAVFAFVGLEVALFNLVPAATMERLVVTMLSGYSWLIVLGAFMFVSWMARSWAESGRSHAIQYMGLGLYTVAQAVIFLPLLYLAMRIDPNIPVFAGAITTMVFAGLTMFVFATRADLASWGKYLALAGLAGMGMIVAGILFGFSFGLALSGIFVVLACGYILYDTSNVLHHYNKDQHVAASLALFASVALLFWYVLQIVMSLSSRD